MGRTSIVALPFVILLALIALVGVLAGGSSFSSAAYVSSSANTATVRAAADWAPPTVELTALAPSLSGTATLSATASDDRSGVASVAIQVQPVGAETWTTLCTDAAAPYSCSWNTTAVTDGRYDVRAVAVDNAGFRSTTDPTRTIVANNVLVELSYPGDVVRGTVPLTATVHNSLITLTTTIEYAVAGTGKWKSLCTGLLSNPTTCSWNTTALPTGLYDLRARAIGVLVGYTSEVLEEVLVDNVAPTVTMTAPTTPLSGMVTLAATATEAAYESGVARVVIQYAASSGSFQTACMLDSAPYSCRFDTTGLPNGSYSFRAVATDLAGNSAVSTTVSNRMVDNTLSSVSVEDPGAYLTGQVAVRATGSSTAGVTSVRIQRAPGGTSTWTDICSVATAPYACTWNTTTVPDGPYDLRAILTDGSGKQTVSAPFTDRRVDNAPLRGVDVQTTNGSNGTAGKVNTSDTMAFTYSRAVTPDSVIAGWNGAPTSVVARFRDGNVAGLGTGNKGDTVDLQVGSKTLGVGSLNLREDFIKSGKTVLFNATLTATTTIVNGVSRTVLTVRLDGMRSGKSTMLRSVSAASAMIWSPSASARTPEGTTCSTAPVTEVGSSDREF